MKNLIKGMQVSEKFAVTSVSKDRTKNGKLFIRTTLSNEGGNISGKIWEDFISQAPIDANKVFYINATVDMYGGNPSLIIQSANEMPEENFMDYVKSSPTLVFDIETSGKKFEDLEEWDREYFLQTLQRHEEDKEKAKEKTGLYPLYGQVIAIGMLNPISKKGSVFVIGNKDIKLEDEQFDLKIFKDEKDLLEGFWKVFVKYERFVTFNGTGFDFPFLMIRSALNKVKVPVEIKIRGEEHIDLMMKFYAGNVYKLEALCRAFGISNPKEKGVSGLHVSRLFEKGKIKDIADYVSRDVVSTSQLYEIWKEYMAGRVII